MARAPGRGRSRGCSRRSGQFLVKVTVDRDPARHQVTSLDEVHQLLHHWVRKACHQRVRSETGQVAPEPSQNSYPQ
jgi:hypothetical protein